MKSKLVNDIVAKHCCQFVCQGEHPNGLNDEELTGLENSNN